MRSKGKSYSEISKAVGAPKSTLSTWLSPEFPFDFNSENQKKHLERIRELSGLALRRRGELRQEVLSKKVTEELVAYPHQEPGFQKAILASLYWAEGAKSLKSHNLKFANTDPVLMKYFITLLRRCFPIKEPKLKVYLQVHYYHEVEPTKLFWSELLQVPLVQFGKVYLKKRSVKKRFRKNSMGICYLEYADNSLRRELLEIGRQLPVLLK